MRVVVLSQNPTSKRAKITVSINAVGFAITAKAKKSPERIRYFKLCLLSVWIPFFWKWLKKINPPRRARVVKARTPISVLLSTNTRKAPIPLVNRRRRSPHPKRNEVWLLSSFSLFLLKVSNASLITPSPKMSTNTPLKAFRFIATVSFAIFKIFVTGAQSQKKNAIKPCQR